ncbi:MAG: hypothetical protein MUC49_15775 [Raineya sp.]|jgi:hypothetical protein|nr:hypothetical protein [Raineya sp.]
MNSSIRLELGRSSQIPQDTAQAKAAAEAFGMAFSAEDAPTYIVASQSSADGGTSSSETQFDGEFLRVPFRAITATMVGAYSFKATDFSTPGVLQSAMKMIVGKAAFKNHDLWDVESAIGTIESAKWTAQNGDIPAGIDIMFKINAKNNPRIANSLQNNEIQSCSVTIDFDWEPSHREKYTDKNGNFDWWEFYWDVGSIAADGKMICRKATKVNDIHECSLVSLGADPYAKRLDSNGKPINIDRAGILSMCKEGNFTQEPILYVKQDLKFQINPEDDFEEAIQFAYSKLKKQYDVNTELNKQKEALESKLSFSKDSTEELNKANEELAKLKEQLAQYEQFEAYKAKAEKYDANLKAQRDEVVRLYKLANPKNIQEELVKLIEGSEGIQLDAFAKQYGGSLINMFSPKCGDCGSYNINHQSTEHEKIENENKVQMSDEEYKRTFKSMKI